MAGTSEFQPPVGGGTTVIEPISAQPSAALTEEQRQRRYKELRERIGRPRLEVRGDPSKHYFWAAKGDSNEMDRLDLIGYSIVREPNVKEILAGKAKPKVQAAGLREDGTYVLGDVILMQCDQEVYEFLMLENEQRATNQQRAAKDNFVFEADKSGVPTFEVDKSKVGGK
jgi:hypothetical protein